MGEIRLRDLSKQFGSARVLDGVSFTIHPGEFVGLMGPNGAGKSTLIKILDGVYTRSSGELTFDGRPVASLAETSTVGFVHQDLGLIDGLSVYENLRLGEKPVRWVGPILNRARERQMAKEALDLVGLDVPVDAPVGALSPGEKTLVAVARLLARGATTLIVDEATSTLPPPDARRFLHALRDATAQGATVILVSHKLSEILDTTERLILLQDGRVTADVSARDLPREDVVALLLPDEHEHGDDAPKAGARPGAEMIRLDRVVAPGVGPISLTISEGEVVGLTGLPGSGLYEVAFLASGQLMPTAGEIVTKPGLRAGLVPPHRETQGGFTDLDVTANLAVCSLPQWRRPSRMIHRAAERRSAAEMIEKLNVLPPDPGAVFGTLSGGNKQKTIFGRMLMLNPDLYVLCEPTRGVDLRTRRALYRLIRELQATGAALLVVTSDFEDLFSVCDRVAVVQDGTVGPFIDAHEANLERLEAFV
jgi:ribose transport system ATP-binding protein